VDCAGSGGTGFAFEMSFDLPESQSAADCWSFNRVQRTGNGGGRLNLWQSSGTGNPFVITPSFYLTGTTDMRLAIAADQDFSVNVYLINSSNVETQVTPTPLLNIIATNPLAVVDYNFTVTPPSAGAYRVRYEFVRTGTRNTASYVDILSIDAALLGNCGGDVNFVTTSDYNPGDFFEVGTTKVSYIAVCNSCTPEILRDTCSFDITVLGVEASTAEIVGSNCGKPNGSFQLSASAAGSSSLEYTIDNGVTWTAFTSPATISDLAGGSYEVNVRAYFPGKVDPCVILAPLNVLIAASADETDPVITACASPKSATTDAENCTVAVPDFLAGLAGTDNCTSSGNLVWTQSPAAGTLVGPGNYTITITLRDEAGNTATCTTTFSVAGFLLAVNDIINTSISATGAIGNILDNDIRNCGDIVPAEITLNLISGPSSPDITVNPATGEVSVTNPLAIGTYTFRYRICITGADPAVCSEADVEINVSDPLPTRSIYLEASRVQRDVHLHWKTESEENTSHFTVEMSLDGRNFQTVPAGSKILAANRSATQKDYYMVDGNVQAPLVYYRVRLYHLDGTTMLSNIAAVRMSEITRFKVYPNPVVGFVTVDFPENGTYAVDLISNSGQLIRIFRDLQITSGMRSITIPRGNIISGGYVLRITNLATGKTHYEKLIYLP
jgi:hypothetical protein